MYSILFVGRILTGIFYCYGITRSFKKDPRRGSCYGKICSDGCSCGGTAGTLMPKLVHERSLVCYFLVFEPFMEFLRREK